MRRLLIELEMESYWSFLVFNFSKVNIYMFKKYKKITWILKCFNLQINYIQNINSTINDPKKKPTPISPTNIILRTITLQKAPVERNSTRATCPESSVRTGKGPGERWSFKAVGCLRKSSASSSILRARESLTVLVLHAY